LNHDKTIPAQAERGVATRRSGAAAGGGEHRRPHAQSMLILYRIGAPLVALGRCRVAVAGTRDPTPWGAHVAREIGYKLAEAGYAVVTGLARGVDEAASTGTLEAGGRVAAVLPYLFEANGRQLNPRAAWLLRAAAPRGAVASAVAENLVKDSRRVREWLAARNRIIAHIATALVVPEARFKPRWGTRHAVERALAEGRPVIVLKPKTKSNDVVKAFEYFMRRGAVAAEGIDEVLGMVERACRAPAYMFKNL